MPAATSASGKAILAALGSDGWHRLLAEAPSPGLAAELDTARRLGYATNVGEVDAGVHTVAAAVTSADGQPVGALIVAAPAGRLPRRQMPPTGRAVAVAAADLSRLLR
jgi:DNA-binding IclR family transcriptional regulator